MIEKTYRKRDPKLTVIYNGLKESKMPANKTEYRSAGTLPLNLQPSLTRDRETHLKKTKNHKFMEEYNIYIIKK